MTRTRSSGPSCWSSSIATRSSLTGFSLARRNLSRHSATAYSMRRVAGQAEADLVALGLGDPALRLQHPPRHVVLLRADQAEDVLLAAVLADEGGGQAEPAAGLDLGRDPEDRGGQQVDLVVDDQAPVALVEELEVREVAVLLGPVGHDLVGGQRDRARSPSTRRCSWRPSVVEVGLVEDLALPLLDGRGAGGQDQRVLARARPWRRCRRSSCPRRRAGR